MLSSTQKTESSIWKLVCWARWQKSWYPEGSVQPSAATRGPHPFRKPVDLAGIALPRTTPQNPCQGKSCHFHPLPWCFSSFHSTCFKTAVYNVISSLRGIRWRPSAAGKAVSAQGCFQWIWRCILWGHRGSMETALREVKLILSMETALPSQGLG